MKQLAVARAIEWEGEPYPENIPMTMDTLE